MSQSLVKNYIHTIFSTKHREPFIDPEIEKTLHAYLGGICNKLECFPVTIGGYNDHVHILSLLSKKIALIKFLEKLKSASSNWIKTQDERYRDFYWQGGYGAFSVSPSKIHQVKKYIESQHEHHRKMTFQEEFRQFLRDHKVEFDERYVWD